MSRRAKCVVAFVLSVVALATVVGIAGIVPVRLGTAVDSNRDKARLAVTDGVIEKVKEVLSEKGDLRLVTLGFNADKTKIVPLVQGKSSSNWPEDWEAFRNSLPESDVAAAVYNFPYWINDDKFAVEPVLITWKPVKGVEPREMARAGYFLGAIMLATKGVNRKFALQNIGDKYGEFCKYTMKVKAEDCDLERTFHSCPFAKTDPKSPCMAGECAGATYQAGGDGAVPKECCEYITEFCRTKPKYKGCGNAVTSQIEGMCNQPPPDETPTVLVVPKEEAKCDDACQKPCALFKNKGET
jgi:hypothetical protein